MSHVAPETFARDWIDAWNRSDVETVLASYADNAVFVSPLAATVTGDAEVHGKRALRDYWMKALGLRKSPLSFALHSYVWDRGTRALVIVYTSAEHGRTVRKCEMMHFGPNGLVERGEAFIGATLG